MHVKTSCYRVWPADNNQRYKWAMLVPNILSITAAQLLPQKYMQVSTCNAYAHNADCKVWGWGEGRRWSVCLCVRACACVCVCVYVYVGVSVRVSVLFCVMWM